MSLTPTLHWLPPSEAWRDQLQAFRKTEQPRWSDAVALAKTRLDFLRTNGLDAALKLAFSEPPEETGGSQPVRLAILGSSTTAHLAAGIRVGGLRRGLWVTTEEADYGQYRQALTEPTSRLHGFAPTHILLALDAHHLLAGVDASLTATEADAVLHDILARIEDLWSLARDRFGCAVMMQTPLPIYPVLMGSNEHRLPGSRAALLRRLNEALRVKADQHGVDLVAMDDRAARDGLSGWHDPALWHRAKQEVAPPAAPVYGDLVARVLAARQGRSAKCLVLDLDNTIWGGVVGDDGTDRLVLGQGSALGEAFAAVQAYAKDLARRGIILAVCSKNDEANALEPFDRHPEMVLKRSDIACFVANWGDKANNIREIATRLTIGLDAMVFVDDNPFERNLVRAALPMVAVPEVPDDPALVPNCLSDAGYFESLAITADDRARTAQYRSNLDRIAIRSSATDVPAYLLSLDMRLIHAPFDRIGLQRITQLINKTNQFNLMTQRLDEAAVAALIDDPNALTIQARLTDRFGDNGMVAVVIGRKTGATLVIDTWLMSCRVLGREVELATLAVLVEAARRCGLTHLIGQYRPTAKNGMVAEHYAKLGFEPMRTEPDGTVLSMLDLATNTAADVPITIVAAQSGGPPSATTPTDPTQERRR
ncbi:HAD-IIIC family phosphatase [Lichenihabitans psoromatis]|uniref:HAD-IIIC family phosphatase n=1 Tax=Lichenihabitans psoromatis TaxID=2528642 RepID=UPI001035C07A|nr:HAD-IIIC family phosphatase [Lichenihabitans psoromatis]